MLGGTRHKNAGEKDTSPIEGTMIGFKCSGECEMSLSSAGGDRVSSGTEDRSWTRRASGVWCPSETPRKAVFQGSGRTLCGDHVHLSDRSLVTASLLETNTRKCDVCFSVIHEINGERKCFKYTITIIHVSSINTIYSNLTHFACSMATYILIIFIFVNTFFSHNDLCWF